MKSSGYYYIVAVNDFGVESEPSETVGATLSSDTELPRVLKISPGHNSYLSRTAQFTLNASDNVSVVKSALYYSLDKGSSWTQFADLKSGYYSASLDTTQLPDGEIRVKGVCWDAAGNESDPLTYAYFVDNTGPEKVADLSYESTSISVTLRWSDVADKDIGSYTVEQKNNDGSYTAVKTVNKTLGANLDDLSPDTEYTYRVVGYDIQNNRGIPSDDLVVHTQTDTTNPVITQIRPVSGSYSTKIDLNIQAWDEYSVKALTVQTSRDGNEWTDVKRTEFTGISKNRSFAMDLNLDDYSEGKIFVRAIAEDHFGNLSDSSSSAPFVQHMIDKTPPAVPSGIKATGYKGYIEIAWEQGSESDLNNYYVYRSEAEDGEYSLCAGPIKSRNYIDRSVTQDKTYYYKLAVDDIAGNRSEESAIVSASIERDEEAPVINGFYPETGTRLGSGFSNLRFTASDNNVVRSIELEYSLDGEQYTALKSWTNLSSYQVNQSCRLPVEKSHHDGQIFVRARATDGVGNTGEYAYASYLIDLDAPVADNAAASFSKDHVGITWTGRHETDLAGYRVYRRSKNGSTLTLIGSRQENKQSDQYSLIDYTIPDSPAQYVYRIEAIDDCGNVSYIETDAVDVPDRRVPGFYPPEAVISCDSVMEAGVQYYIDGSQSSDDKGIASYVFDFGDGTTSNERKPVHVYQKPGTYTVTLTVTDTNGLESVATRTVQVKERKTIGRARIRVVDENGTPVPNAPVYFDLGDDNQYIRATEDNGYVTFDADAGKHTIGCVIPNNEWLPVKKDIIITANQETAVTLVIVHQTMIEGSFEIEKMTFDEIAAAGIDVSAPENQYYVTIHLTLTYGKAREDKIETSFLYNQVTGDSNARPVIIHTSTGDKRQVIPFIVAPRRYTGDTDGSGEGAGSAGSDYYFEQEPSIAILNIPVGVSILKEFFNVNLHIINNSGSEFSMVNNTVTLNVPSGLTIVNSNISEPRASVVIPEIPGQTTSTISWILRGDELGEHWLSADFNGTLSEFDEPIYTRFEAPEPIEVLGLSDLKVTVEIPDSLDHGTFYYNAWMSNMGRTDLYRPRLDTPGVILDSQIYSFTGDDLSALDDMSFWDLIDKSTGNLLKKDSDVLKPGASLVNRCMVVDQTKYTEAKLEFLDCVKEFTNTYGLSEDDVEIIVKPLSYFKRAFDSNVNPVEKVENILKNYKMI